MADKVNANFIVTRDGAASVTALKGISYGKLVTIEAALANAQASLCVWGIGRLAQLPGYAANPGPWTSDVSVVLDADFDGGGSAKFSAEWNGLAAKDADQIQAIIAAAMADPLK
jgi:hypothetical protein